MDAAAFTVQPYLTLANNKRVDLHTLEMWSIGLVDLAHGLSHENRYGGHTPRPYSVLEHLLLADWIYVTDCAERGEKPHRQARLALLMHDAHEALVKDIPTPLKKVLPDYRDLESRVECALLDRFGLLGIMDRWHQNVRYYDLRALNTEAVAFGMHDDSWPSLESWPAARMVTFLEVWCVPGTESYRRFRMREHWVSTVADLLGEDE